MKKFFSAAKKLPFDERVELAHRLWDEFMDGFQDWKAPPIPKGKFPWKTLKADIDAKIEAVNQKMMAIGEAVYKAAQASAQAAAPGAAAPEAEGQKNGTDGSVIDAEVVDGGKN